MDMTALDVSPGTLPKRYTATAQVLHWMVAALMFTVVPLNGRGIKRATHKRSSP